MKKIAISLLTATMMGLGFSQAAFAMKGDTSVDAGVGIGTSSAGFGTGLGFTAGGGYEILNNTQARGDFNFFHYSSSGLSYNRIMFSASGRQYFPLQKKLKAYGQVGLLISIDKVDLPSFTFLGVPVSGGSVSTTHVGINPAVGIQYEVTPKISVGAQATYYIITDSFLGLQATAAYHF